MAGMNILVIIAAAVAAWLAGAVYYTALAKPWVAAQGLTVEQHKAMMDARRGTIHAWLPFVLAFLADLVMACVMSGLIGHIGAYSLRGGIISAAFVWVGFVLTTIIVNNAFAGRRYMLTVMDSLHWLLGLLVIGAIVGVWGA
jgi:hypothetical protein